MSKTSWLRIGAAIVGAGAFVASFFVPPAAAILAPVGTFAVGYAMRAPGDVSAAELRARGEAAARAAADAATRAVAEHAGKAPAQVAAAVGAAAATAATQAFVAKPNPY